MKKFLISLVATLGVFVLLPAASFAASTQTVVSGTVTNNGHPVSGAKVTVVCDNNDIKTVTTSAGAYAVIFSPSSKCPNGANATVVATKGAKGGVDSGKVNKATDKINVAIINVSLPEFGTIVGVSAAVLGAGAFLVIRRRQLGAR